MTRTADDHDNCLAFSNPSQRDRDWDGVGDACDLCPGVFDRHYSDPDLDGFNNNACDDCPEFDEGVDTDGDGFLDTRPDTDFDGITDACDVCVSEPDRPGAPNCNLDSEIAEGKPQLPDACDPSPCPEGNPRSRPTDSGLSPFESVFENSAIDLVGRRQDTAAFSSTAEAGVRFCPCEIATADSIEARTECALNAEYDCDIEPTLFESEDPVRVNEFETRRLTI